MSTVDSVIPHTSIRRVEAEGVSLLPRSGPGECAGRVIAAWLSEIFVSISGFDSAPG
jgi:hypothetical protein